jgi:hypothetical protein
MPEGDSLVNDEAVDREKTVKGKRQPAQRILR